MAARQAWSRTRKIRTLSLIGFAVYVVSYFLYAAHVGVGKVRGWEAAWITIKVVRFTPESFDSIGEYVAALISGWINPLFLITYALLVRNPDSRVGAVLRVVPIAMFPACWVVLYAVHAAPNVGYFVWTAAMLLALFAGKLFRRPGTGAAPNNAAETQRR